MIQTSAPTITSHDRLGFTLCMALAVHALIILGVGFAPLDPADNTGISRLEITLAQHSSKQAVEQADYIAETNQQASGTENKKRELTSTELAEFVDPRIHETSQQSTPASSKSSQQQKIPQITTQRSQFLVSNTLVSEEKTSKRSDSILDERQQQIASLQAKLDQQEQMLAKKPRIHRLTSLSTKASADAAYLYRWQSRIEHIGNQYYPEEARRRKLYGSLRLLVAVNSDGRIVNLKILQSSGQQILDDAAIRIVRLAEPFPPFSRELRETTDILEIIRTWRFEKNQLSSSS